VLGNVKTSLSGAYHAFDFGKYAGRYLAAIAYRFNRRFQLKTLPERLLVAAVGTGPRPEAWLRWRKILANQENISCDWKYWKPFYKHGHYYS